MQKEFNVIKKELLGKEKTPSVTMTTEEGDKLKLILTSKKELAQYFIHQLISVSITIGQKTLTPK